MTTEIIYSAPAKINLFLNVVGKRPDGYHDIESVMQTVSLFDILTITKEFEENSKKIIITCDNSAVPCNEKNLCYKAAVLFFEAAGINSYNIKIHIEKHIPMAAGLGGGSSDAAAVITALDKLYNTNLPIEMLFEIGAKIGADVPFCIEGGIKAAKGIGNIFSKCAPIPECHILVACEGEGVSTPWAYSELDKVFNYSENNTLYNDYLDILSLGVLDKIAKSMYNIFELVILNERKTVLKIKTIMEEYGALKAMLSGSGPSVFGIYKDIEKAKKASEALKACGIASQLCKPYSPANR